MSSGIYLFVIGLSLVLTFLSLSFKAEGKVQGKKIILGILLLVMVFESFGEYTAQKGINNSLLYNICWIYIESLLLILYFLQFEKSKTAKKIFFIIFSVLLVWGIFNSVFFQPISTVFQFYSFLPNSIFILVLCVRFLNNILNLLIFKDWNLIALPHFWISTAILFFYSEAVLVFGFYQFSPQFVVDNVSVIFGFNRLMAGMMYLIFGVSFFLPSLFKTNFTEGNNMAML
ncbi:hypothetical protein MMU07_08550 [Aquiflexum sp. LQ15W]|uniref:hypothetical protein n=1 Tax=Cognataquiflexum nitidum TaxID=2922272 RepID=UPI001F1491E4|nr:hypothetical protein [Cognataquiflexum nitidum]MCH6199626.1 hypothetical protein [Cognataquiflexum nitidum]